MGLHKEVEVEGLLRGGVVARDGEESEMVKGREIRCLRVCSCGVTSGAGSGLER